MEAVVITRNETRPREERLIRLVQGGDMAAFEEMYRSHLGRVFALCMRMCGDRSRAEDLTQAVFVKVWERIESFRGEGRFSSWLRQITLNIVLGEFRARKRRFPFEQEPVDPDTLPVAAAVPVEGARKDLEAAIAGLPDGARRVFVLHEIEGFRHGEIALLIGRSTGTCKAQLHRARKLLRKALGS